MKETDPAADIRARLWERGGGAESNIRARHKITTTSQAKMISAATLHVCRSQYYTVSTERCALTLLLVADKRTL